MPEKSWVKGHFRKGQGYIRPHLREKRKKKSLEFKASNYYSWLKHKEDARKHLIREWADRLQENKGTKQIEKQINKLTNEIDSLNNRLGRPSDNLWSDAKTLARVKRYDTIKQLIE